jgi:hypothetical protein
MAVPLMKISTCLLSFAPCLLPLALLATTVDTAQAQSLLFEDDFEDGVIDPNLWEVHLPQGNSSATETGGVMLMQNRAWLMDAPLLTGLDLDLIVEGEVNPGSGGYWETWLYANKAQGIWSTNTDGLSFQLSPYADLLWITGMGNVQATQVSGPCPNGSEFGYRLTTLLGVATFEVWDLANPSDKTTLQTTFTKLAGAGERFICFNREFGSAASFETVKVSVFSLDCNDNGIPDDQDIAGGTSSDCNGNGMPDECDLESASFDCDANGLIDSCEIVNDPALDCDDNGILDACDLQADPTRDCNGNGALDTCDLANGPSLDCNGNSILDSCDITDDPSLDCDSNESLDSCELADDPGLDCNGNGALDSCDIAGDGSLDQNTNGILDTCECFTSNYCLAAGNSSGTNSIIASQGSLSVTTNDFVLTEAGAPPLKFGVFFYGAAQGQVILGEGMLCVATPVQRIQPVLLTDEQGDAALAIDFTQEPFNSGAFAVNPFSTWNFQFWYRDPLGGPAGFNFSNGLEVTFCP